VQRRRQVLGAVALGVAAVLVLAGCSSSGGGNGGRTSGSTPSPSATSSADAQRACDAVTTRLLASVQRYVDRYGATLSSKPGGSESPGSGDDTELRSDLQQAQREVLKKKCDIPAFRADFAAGLDKVTADGPLARAVLLRLTASVTGTLGSNPQTVAVSPGQDLARKVAALAPGSTVTLRAGRYVLRRPLVLLAGITIAGAGRQRTTISSPVAGSLMLVLNDGRTELRDLSVTHTGRRPASVLVGGPSSSIVLTDARLSGGFSPPGSKDGQSGNGVLMTARPNDTTTRGTTLQMTRSQLSGNSAAGLLLTGAHRASVRSSAFRSNGQCGICFAGVSSGAARSSTFTDNAVAVAVFDRAKPLLQKDTVTGGQVGVQVSGKGAPQVSDVRVTGASRAGFIYSESGNGRVNGATCNRVPYGIVVGPQSYPYIGRTSCQLAKGR
jgi:hypothetical protein